jgi:hypothetical protein
MMDTIPDVDDEANADGMNVGEDTAILIKWAHNDRCSPGPRVDHGEDGEGVKIDSRRA